MPRPISSRYAPSLERPESSLSNDEARHRWAKGLNEQILRSLAAEYLMGNVGQDCADAYKEYERRFPEEAAGRRR